MKTQLYSLLLTLACTATYAEELPPLILQDAAVDESLAEEEELLSADSIPSELYATSLTDEMLPVESLPFELTAQRMKKAKDPLMLYGNMRMLYGESIDTHADGKMRSDLEQLRIGLRYQRDLWYDWFFKMDMRGVFLHRNNHDTHGKDEIWDANFEMRELYFENKHIIATLPIGVLGGRKQFRDSRGWWYDNQLDVIQLQYNSTLVNAQLSYGGRVIDERVTSEEQNAGLEDSQFMLARLNYQFRYQHHFQGFVTYQHDDYSENKVGHEYNANSRIKSELDLTWIGFRFNGLFALPDNSDLNYWFDFATVVGSEEQYETTTSGSDKRSIKAVNKVNISNAYGIDLGLTWKAPSNRWGVSANYAYGSGDNSDSSSQSGYRQSTLSNNTGRLFNETASRYRLYGEFLRPELSNLQLVSLSSGTKLGDYLWLQGSYFYYWQVEADTDFNGSILSATPNGINKNIGGELDVTLSASWDPLYDIQLTMSGYHAGDAFDHVASSKYAFMGLLEFKLHW
ncbi:MAG: hypothetical protein GQ582_01315 [Methyloprofundus sp.]|nr:hypothetical protein [Methyloprofundus sp.]